MFNEKLHGLRVAVLAADGFEQIEVTSPVKALRNEGAEVRIVSLRPGNIKGVNLLYPGRKIHVDCTVFTVSPNQFDALVIPGGLVNPDLLRQNEHALDFVREFDRQGKPIAVICHGPWVLISAGLVNGRTLTSWPGIRDDVLNAGGVWEDRAVVRDENWVSSRGPHDLPKFKKAMISLFSEYHTAMPQSRSQPRDEGLPVAGLMAAGLAIAALIYGTRHTTRQTAQIDRAENEPVSVP